MKDINAPPIVDYDKCTSCKKCVGICPGLAIFVIQNKDGKALITLQFEFLPVPEVGSRVKALDRMGKNIGTAVIKKVIHKNKTMVVTIEVKEDLAMDVRNIKV
jgi:Fe-S-cluster-containing hydrogenase component 2